MTESVNTDPSEENGRERAPASSFIDRADLGVAFVILVGCGLLYWTTAGFEEVSGLFAQDVPPEFFPRLVIGVVAVLTLALPFEQFFVRKSGKYRGRDGTQNIRPSTYITAACLVAVVASIAFLGAALAMFAVCLALPVLWGERRIKVILPYAILMPLAVTLVFSYLLGVHFEPGVLGLVLR